MKRNGIRARCSKPPIQPGQDGRDYCRNRRRYLGHPHLQLLPQILGFGIFSNGNWYVGAGTAVTTPLLSQAFFHFVPYLTVVWVLTILLDILLLRLGHWNMLTRLTFIGLKIVNIVIAAAMLGVPSLLAITTASLTPAMGSAGAAQTLVTMLNLFVRIALWLGIFGSVVEIIRPSPGWQPTKSFPS